MEEDGVPPVFEVNGDPVAKLTQAPHTDDGRPLLVAIADDASRRALLQTELAGRYGVAYQVVVMHLPIAAQAVLEEARAAGTRVSVVLASQWMAEMNGSAPLAWVRSRHPRSKRALLVAVDDWGRENTAAAIRSAIGSGCADHYLGAPARPGDEVFHRAISGFLYDWTRAEDASAWRLAGPGTRAADSHDLEIEIPKLVYELLSVAQVRQWHVSVHRGAIQVLAPPDAPDLAPGAGR